LLHPSEVELGETVRGIIECCERKPIADRVVLDSLSELRLLAQNRLRLFPANPPALKHFFCASQMPVLMLDDRHRRNQRSLQTTFDRPRRSFRLEHLANMILALNGAALRCDQGCAG